MTSRLQDLKYREDKLGELKSPNANHNARRHSVYDRNSRVSRRMSSFDLNNNSNVNHRLSNLYIRNSVFGNNNNKSTSKSRKNSEISVRISRSSGLSEYEQVNLNLNDQENLINLSQTLQGQIRQYKNLTRNDTEVGEKLSRFGEIDIPIFTNQKVTNNQIKFNFGRGI